MLGEVLGQVEIRNPGQADFSPALDGAILMLGGQVRTGTDSGASLSLSSGTILRLAPESYLTFSANEQAASGPLTRLSLAAGQVWVVLEAGQVQVETVSGSASVRGSYMSVWIDPLTSDVWVTCLEGWCMAENPSAVLEMVAGQGCMLYSWNPEGSTPPPPPKLRYLSQEDIDTFLQKNPEAAEVMSAIIATATALPPLPVAADPVAPESCLELLQPASGLALITDAPIVFDWGDQPGAYKYILTLTKPNGGQKSIIAWDSTLTVDPYDLPFAGNYQWQVTAYDQDIQPLCSAGPWTFYKADTLVPTPAADCFQLTSPADEVEIGEDGELTFSWTEQPGRLKYIFTLYSPRGMNEISRKVYTNSLTLDLADIPVGGEYLWQVTAYDTNYRPMCTAGPWAFTKPGTSVPTPEPGSCVTLLYPPDGTYFEGSNAVNFTWTEYPGAYKYIISFKPPSTAVSNFLAWTPEHLRFVESFTPAGTYQWWVTVKNEAIQDVCTSAVFTFSKPDTGYLVPPPEGGESGAKFSGQSGPTGAQASCSALQFGVTTSLSGTIKLVYATDPGFSENWGYKAIGEGPGSASVTKDFSSFAGKTVYWRYAVYGDTWIYDSYVGSFSCP
jgi:hypothetical protein